MPILAGSLRTRVHRPFRPAQHQNQRLGGQNDVFHYQQDVKAGQANSHITGWIRYRNSREVSGEVKNVTVRQPCGKWYVSLRTEYEVADPVHNAGSMVGLDTGVTKLATLSDGTVYQPVNRFNASQRKLPKTEAKNPASSLAYGQYPARLPSQSHQ